MSPKRKSPKTVLAQDAVMRSLIKIHEPPVIGRSPVFISLVRGIISQQISEAAASSIYKRLKALSDITPAALLELSPETIRSCGISNPKVGYIQSIAQSVLAGELDKIETMPDEEAIKKLVQLKGVGRWTAEMILIFALGRDNVWACDDAGLRRAARRLYGCSESVEDFKALGERFVPYRSHAPGISGVLWIRKHDSFRTEY